MNPPRILDLFCGAGGAAMGYSRAGFDVVGVDHVRQRRYPFRFVRADALEAVAALGDLFDAVHASPPCQAYSRARNIERRDYPDLVAATRAALEATGRPYVIENVPGSPLLDYVVLEGQMFDDLRTQRPRWFETNWPLEVPFLRAPRMPHAKMGRPPRAHEWITVVGNVALADRARAAMGIEWMSRAELAQAIPPAYTEYIGRQLAAVLER